MLNLTRKVGQSLDAYIAGKRVARFTVTNVGGTIVKFAIDPDDDATILRGELALNEASEAKPENDKLTAAYFLAQGSYSTAKDLGVLLLVEHEDIAEELKHLAANFDRIRELLEESGLVDASDPQGEGLTNRAKCL